MKNIAIYGGAFDPIHKGHVAIIEELSKIKEMDEVWIMPTRVSRWKDDAAPSSLRLKCINKVIENYSNVRVMLNEIESDKEIIYTYDTIKELKHYYTDVNFYFVIGYDQLIKLDKWYKIDELSKMVTFLVIARPKHDLHQENCIKYNCKLLNFSGPDISSSDFRNSLNLDLLPNCIHSILLEDLYYYQNKLNKMISLKRYHHSISVMNLAKRIAKIHGLDENLASLAGLLHDCAKELDIEQEEQIMNKYFNDCKNVSKSVYHQFTGVIIVEKEFKIKNELIKQSILYHTTANKDMTWLDKLIYAVDKIEPLRGYDSTYMIKALEEDLDEGFKLVLSENIKFLESKHISYDFKWTIDAIECYLKK